MRAVVIPKYGDADVLELREIADPEPGPDQVSVEVVASAMNRADLLQRAGQYPAPGPGSGSAISRNSKTSASPYLGITTARICVRLQAHN
jgi:threonine dehydrogenase-like Zn-dependent dehydrogenase